MQDIDFVPLKNNTVMLKANNNGIFKVMNNFAILIFVVKLLGISCFDRVMTMVVKRDTLAARHLPLHVTHSTQDITNSKQNVTKNVQGFTNSTWYVTNSTRVAYCQQYTVHHP